ncbi:hypothetical protein [Kribbella sp. NPDC049584]|uniref:hypothetical protein n=1 Tax=Kribbella sp. NPDC049584 TaxID=3154833 RepID=UPI003427254E
MTGRVNPQDFPGRSTAAEFETPSGPVLFVNHKPNWQVGYERERELQALGVARWIDQLAADRDARFFSDRSAYMC